MFNFCQGKVELESCNINKYFYDDMRFNLIIFIYINCNKWRKTQSKRLH